MTIALQVLLALVLAAAALGKLLDLSGSQRAVREFGVPDRLARVGGPALPFIELVLAFGLLVAATAQWAAVLTGLLFLSFIAAIGWNLAKGRQPNCHCFGQLHSEPAGWPAIARNTFLTCAAAIIAWRGGTNPVWWSSNLSTAGQVAIILGMAVLVVAGTLVWTLTQLAGQNERMLKRFTRLGVPAPAETLIHSSEVPAALTDPRLAPEFDLPDQDGRRLTLAGLLQDGLPALLIFSDPSCGPCNSLMPDVGEWQRRYAHQIRIALISRRSLAENLAKSVEHGIAFVGLQEDREIDEIYRADGTPTGILVQSDGTIRHPNALGPDPIRALFARALANQERAKLGHPALPAEHPSAWDDADPFAHLPTSLELGALAPTLPLRDLNGHFSGLEDGRGHETIVVFVSPACEFSRRLLPGLREWAQNDAGPILHQLAIVSDGKAEEVRQMNLPGQVLVDEGFTLGRAFGASGTPSAVVIDADRRVATPLAVGEDAVLDLLYDRSDAVLLASTRTDNARYVS